MRVCCTRAVVCVMVRVMCGERSLCVGVGSQKMLQVLWGDGWWPPRPILHPLFLYHSVMHPLRVRVTECSPSPLRRSEPVWAPQEGWLCSIWVGEGCVLMVHLGGGGVFRHVVGVQNTVGVPITANSKDLIWSPFQPIFLQQWDGVFILSHSKSQDIKFGCHFMLINNKCGWYNHSQAPQRWLRFHLELHF